MNETPKRLEWPVVRDKIVRLMEDIKKSVGWMTDNSLHPAGILGQEAWIGRRGADIVVALEALLERNAELEVAARKVVAAGTIDPRYCPYCECPECTSMRTLIALLPEKEKTP